MTRRPTALLLAFVVTTVVAATALTGVVGPLSPGHPLLRAQTVRLRSAAVKGGRVERLRTSVPVQMVGFDWRGRTGGAVQVRALQRGGWSPWLRVEGNPDEGPDEGPHQTSGRAPGRTGAGPVWVGSGVRRLEARVGEGRLDDLRLHAIRTEGPRGGLVQLPAAGAAPAQPAIIGRAQWGADEGWRNCTPESADAVRYAFVHHTDNSNAYRRDQSAALVRGIYWFHTHVNHWCDIGYNFLVDRYGQVFEGRAGGVGGTVVGSHAAGFNTGSTGVALIGTFQSSEVPPAMYQALRGVLAWKLAHHGVDPGRQITVRAGSGSKYPEGTPVTVWTISGHRDVNSTDCPGDVAYGLLTRLRSDVKSDVGGGGDSGLLGILDEVTRLLGAVHLKGWAVDSRSGGPASVRVEVDGRPALTLPADVARPALAAAHPEYGANHGFDGIVVVGLGQHRVCVTAERPGGGKIVLGCQTV